VREPWTAGTWVRLVLTFPLLVVLCLVSGAVGMFSAPAEAAFERWTLDPWAGWVEQGVSGLLYEFGWRRNSPPR
jgi:hypothetical protein